MDDARRSVRTSSGMDDDLLTATQTAAPAALASDMRMKKPMGPQLGRDGIYPPLSWASGLLVGPLRSATFAAHPQAEFAFFISSSLVRDNKSP